MISEAPKHTPAPWHYYEHSHDLKFVVGDATTAIAHICPSGRRKLDEANAAFIVRAVNSHEELLAALYNLKTWIEADAKGYCAKELRAVSLERHLAVARAAIAKAEGRT